MLVSSYSRWRSSVSQSVTFLSRFHLLFLSRHPRLALSAAVPLSLFASTQPLAFPLSRWLRKDIHASVSSSPVCLVISSPLPFRNRPSLCTSAHRLIYSHIASSGKLSPVSLLSYLCLSHYPHLSHCLSCYSRWSCRFSRVSPVSYPCYNCFPLSHQLEKQSLMEFSQSCFPIFILFASFSVPFTFHNSLSLSLPSSH